MKALASAWTCAVVAAAALATGVVLVGCPASFNGDCTDTDTCGGPGVDGGVVDAARDVASDSIYIEEDGASCDISKSPHDDPCVLIAGNGIFVSPLGSDDSGEGTPASPFKTIGHALAQATTVKKLFVCATAGTYAEHVTFGVSDDAGTSGVSIDGVTIYGGLTCPGGDDGGATAWGYAAGSVAAVVPATPGYALEMDNLTTGAVIEDMGFVSQNGAVAGDSSVGVFVNGSANVAFTRCTFTAGNGAPAANTDPGAKSNYAGSATNGAPATGLTGGPAVNCSCTNGDTTQGAAGGGGAATGATGGGSGLPPIPENPTGLTPKHDGAGGASGCTNGDPGADPINGDGAAGTSPTAIGTIGTTGWKPTPGGTGQPGHVAQGGGGGGGVSLSGGGGGGACGGCGGGGGIGGAAGGSSIALLIYNSGNSSTDAVQLNACTITAGNGTNGGPGGTAQPGQTGGIRGTQVGNACPGGQGGNGGNGGGGAGGTGGGSLGVAYSGNKPQVDAQTKTTTGSHGTGGPGGLGGGAAVDAGAGNEGQQGANGLSNSLQGF
jgi:hypothetical protein